MTKEYQFAVTHIMNKELNEDMHKDGWVVLHDDYC